MEFLMSLATLSPNLFVYSFLKMEGVDILAKLAFMQVIVGFYTAILVPTSFLALLVFPKVM